jgi:hypothetical protein
VLVLTLVSFCRTKTGLDLAWLIIGGEARKKNPKSVSDLTAPLPLLAAIIFLVVGIFAFIVVAKARQSRPLVICFMITMICFFIVALVQVTRPPASSLLLC